MQALHSKIGLMLVNAFLWLKKVVKLYDFSIFNVIYNTKWPISVQNENGKRNQMAAGKCEKNRKNIALKLATIPAKETENIKREKFTNLFYWEMERRKIKNLMLLLVMAVWFLFYIKEQ